MTSRSLLFVLSAFVLAFASRNGNSSGWTSPAPLPEDKCLGSITTVPNPQLPSCAGFHTGVYYCNDALSGPCGGTSEGNKCYSYMNLSIYSNCENTTRICVDSCSATEGSPCTPSAPTCDTTAPFVQDKTVSRYMGCDPNTYNTITFSWKIGGNQYESTITFWCKCSV